MNRRVLLGTGVGAALALTGIVAWRSSTGSMTDYEAYARSLRAPLNDDPDIADLLRCATLAANSHNTQPWRFRVEPGAIAILSDPSRRTPVVDPDDHHLFVSLGCAAENLVIAATATGRPGALDSAPDGSVHYRFATGRPAPNPLLAAILTRQSTRGDYNGRAVPSADVAALARAAAMPGVRVAIITDARRLDAVRDLVIAGNSAQMADEGFMRELKQWLRFNPRNAMAAGDGLFAAASGNPVLPDRLGGLAFDRFFTAQSENDKYARHLASSAGAAVFLAERADRAHWIAVGRACQRFALTATSLGLKHAFINQPVEIARLRPALTSLVGEAGLRPDIVMRFGYGPALPFSPRRAVAAVMTQGD
jgi:nitroreductase